MVKTDGAVYFREQWFHGTEQGVGFDANGSFILSLFTTPPAERRGTYFSALALSPLAYRREHGSKAWFRRIGSRRLAVSDDRNTPHLICGDEAFIDALQAECVANELREKSQ